MFVYYSYSLTVDSQNLRTTSMTGVLAFQDPLAAVVEGDVTQLQRALWAFVCTAIKNKQSVSCLAWTRLQERADYSHRSEMTKHNLNLLLWKLSCPGSASDSCKHHPRGKCCNYVHCKIDAAIGPVVSLHASTASRCWSVWRVSFALKLYGSSGK